MKLIKLVDLFFTSKINRKSQVSKKQLFPPLLIQITTMNDFLILFIKSH